MKKVSNRNYKYKIGHYEEATLPWDPLGGNGGVLLSGDLLGRSDTGCGRYNI